MKSFKPKHFHGKLNQSNCHRKLRIQSNNYCHGKVNQSIVIGKVNQSIFIGKVNQSIFMES